MTTPPWTCLLIALLGMTYAYAQDEPSWTVNAAQLYAPQAGPYEVATVPSLKLHDEAREKVLWVRVTYPQGVARADEPCPVIFWSHGMFGSKDGYQPLVRFWASYGYVVIQPTHEDSLSQGNTTFGDFAQGSQYWKTRPADVSFLLDSMLAIAGPIEGLPKLDLKRMGIGGHSFGAHTTMLLAGVQPKNLLRPLHEAYLDLAEDRFKCALMVSPQGPGPMFTPRSFSGFRLPGLMITGTMDQDPIQGRPYSWRLEAYNHLPASADGQGRKLVVLNGARHDFGGISGVRYAGSGPRNEDQVALMRSLTLAFWDLHLNPARAAKARDFLTPQGMEAAVGSGATIQSK